MRTILVCTLYSIKYSLFGVAVSDEDKKRFYKFDSGDEIFTFYGYRKLDDPEEHDWYFDQVSTL